MYLSRELIFSSYQRLLVGPFKFKVPLASQEPYTTPLSFTNQPKCPFPYFTKGFFAEYQTMPLSMHQSSGSILVLYLGRSRASGRKSCDDGKLHWYVKMSGLKISYVGFVVGLLGRMDISASLPKIESVGLVSLILCHLASHGHG